MSAAAMKPSRRGPAHNRKIDPAKMAHQAAAGLSTYEIAKLHGVNQSNVQRFLSQYEIEKEQTERYKANRADLLSHTGSKLQAIVNRVVNSMEVDAENGVLDALDLGERGKLVRDLSVVQGIIFDKERLERGESTANVSTVSRMVDASVSSLHKRNTLIDNDSAIDADSRT